MEVSIRRAEMTDMGAVFGLVKDLAVFEKEPEAVTTSEAYYREKFDEGLFSAHVAEVEGKIVGMALYYDTFSTWKGKMLYLEDFVVKSDYRSYGIGKKLFDAYLAEAKERNCTIAKWEVLDWNKEAIRFYEREGAIIEKCWWDGKIFLP